MGRWCYGVLPAPVDEFTVTVTPAGFDYLVRLNQGRVVLPWVRD